MTFPIFGSEYAPGTIDIRPAVAPDSLKTNAAAIDFVRLFGLDRLSCNRRLVCHWHREVNGRLACLWEPDIVPIPQR
jgi:hypothetical protein